MSNKIKSFLCLVAFIIMVITYHIIVTRSTIDPTPKLAKVEVIKIRTLVKFK